MLSSGSQSTRCSSAAAKATVLHLRAAVPPPLLCSPVAVCHDALHLILARVSRNVLQVGLWILWSTWQLFDCYRKNQLAQHPMFAFTANQHAAAAVHMASQPAAAPAQPVNPFAYGGTPGSYQPPVVQGYPAPHHYSTGAGRV
jgi:hypothetical protein